MGGSGLFIIVFGAVLAIVGVILFAFFFWVFKGGRGVGENDVVQVFNIKIHLTHPALVIFVIGCLMTVTPLFLPLFGGERVEYALRIIINPEDAGGFKRMPNPELNGGYGKGTGVTVQVSPADTCWKVKKWLGDAPNGGLSNDLTTGEYFMDSHKFATVQLVQVRCAVLQSQ